MKKVCQICICPIGFISLYLFVLTLATKLKDANYKSHGNILVFCDNEK